MSEAITSSYLSLRQAGVKKAEVGEDTYNESPSTIIVLTTMDIARTLLESAAADPNRSEAD
jgi:hypothetical protein